MALPFWAAADDYGAKPCSAYAMNGETLPLQHGYPVRLVVPSWYSPCLLAAEFALLLSRLRDA